MSPLEHLGLRVHEISTPDEAAAVIDRAGRGRPNVVHLDPEGRDWGELRARGFLVRPTWIAWIAEVPRGSASLIAAQARKPRQGTRMGLRNLESMQMQVYEPVDPDAFDLWLGLYTAQVAGMRFGLNLAAEHRGSVLDPASGELLVVWRRDGEIVCGCIVRIYPVRSILHVRFSAVAPGSRKDELVRGMYAAAADLAVDRDLRWLSLGRDINFYATVVKPGLCAFKLRLGLRPVPAHALGQDAPATVAERIVDIGHLELPVLCWEYTGSSVPGPAEGDLLTRTDLLSLVSVMPHGKTSDVLELLPAHRRLTID